MATIRLAVIWLTALAVTGTPPVYAGDAHDEGAAAGRAANPVARGAITAPSAAAVVPEYTATPPQRAFYGQPSLQLQANARLAACLAAPADPACQALLGARASANTPREAISPFDPAVLGARRVAANPAGTLENIASYYSGCEVTPVSLPPKETRICRQYSGAAPQSCARTLGVTITRAASCTPGDWFAEARAGTIALGVQCKVGEAADAQHLRVTSSGAVLAAFDADMTGAWVFPRKVATIARGNGVTSGDDAVWLVDNRCDGDRCSATGFVALEFARVCSGSGSWGDESTCANERPFLENYDACPAGTQSGDRIAFLVDPDGGTGSGDGGAPQIRYLDAPTCYAPSADGRDRSGWDVTGAVAGDFWRAHSARPVTGYRINPAFGPVPRMTLTYERPRMLATEQDQWANQCPQLQDGGRCAASGAARCVDGPATKDVEGVRVRRDCWRYETPLACQGSSSGDECAPLAGGGCSLAASTCQRRNPDTGACAITERRYSCPSPAGGAPGPESAAGTSVRASRCPANVFCLAGNCFNTAHAPDADFARSMSFLEAAREAGVYLDTDALQVFNGEANQCRDRLLKNCCYTDTAGANMSNQSMFGVGSRLVYDVLMNAGNREFLLQGMQALLMSGGFSGSFTSYGVTVAVNGTALPAGSSVLYAGDSVVVAFDPWSLAVAVVIYVVMSMMSCSEDEGKLAMKQGAGLCHAVGTYCSSCIRVLGHCVSCITHTTAKCCFNSALSRIVNEQGRAQLGKGWGSAQSPDCSGFTVAQLQRLDFSRMDLTEFYASIVPTLPNAGLIQDGNAARAPRCYYGEGRCQ